MNTIKYCVIGLCFVTSFSTVVQGQEKTQLIDLFYQAIIKEDDTRNDDASKFTEISLVNYEGEIINPRVLIERYPDTKKYMLNDSIMTINSGVVIQGFIEDLSKLDSRIIIENFHFKKNVLLNLSLYGELESEIFNASVLRIRHCVFDDLFLTWFSNFNLDFRDNSFNELSIINETVTSPSVVIENNTIGYFHFWTATPGIVTIAKNQIGYVEIDLSSFRNLKLLKNRISGIGTANYSQEEIIGRKYWKSYINSRRAQRLVALDKLSEDSLYSYNDISGKVLFQMNSLNRVVSELEIIGNSFLDPTHSNLVIFSQNSISMEVSGNTFETPVIMAPSVSGKFIIEDNNFHSISMDAAIPATPQNEVSIDWQDIKGKLYYQKHEELPAYYGETDEDLANSQQFFKLVAGYSRLLEVYKGYGNLDDANDVFLDMKALHLKRYEYLYRTEGGTTNFFQLYLNKLLKIYTRHGTDPAQAMTASLWIIIFFSLIYFFFPSDWDASSKSKLIKNFKAFTEKNDKGYFRPFLSLVKGVLYSFFNAITLSVNSFVTLGFGTIPTKGLAKYICIFQGFLGWFLLSIFIVALINQILI
ncbi:two pore domain potassium channel family protein [Psychroserpens burtonensis]|nr:two pore domain potassium channel family protein [Psychroserpens burtonensis]